MRELTVRIRFITPSLGNAKDGAGRFLLPRSPRGAVTFMPTWHAHNLRFAARTLGRHQDAVAAVRWDAEVDGRDTGWYRRYHAAAGGGRRYANHEAFLARTVVGVNCVAPAAIGDDDFWRLMELAGKYSGLSPFHPGKFGFFEVVSIRPRRPEPEAKTSRPDGAATPHPAGPLHVPRDVLP